MAEENGETRESERSVFSILKWLLSGKRFYAVLILIVLAGALYYFRSAIIAATVNGEIITRLELIQELEAQGGAQVLDSIITEKLVVQEAKKQNITISDSEIDSQISEIEKGLEGQGQSLDDVLGLQNIGRDELKERIRVQIMIERLAESDLDITDEAISEYFETNKSFYPEETSLDDVKEDIKNQLRQQELSQNIQNTIQELREGASINYFVNL